MNPYVDALSFPDLSDTGADRLIRDFCKTMSFDPTKQVDANPFRAILDLGVPANTSAHKKIINRLNQLVKIYDDQAATAAHTARLEAAREAEKARLAAKLEAEKEATTNA